MILEFKWDFIPESPIQEIEVRPCIDEAGGVREANMEEEIPHFWGVYCRYNENDEGFGIAPWIADCSTESEANLIKTFLTNLCVNYKPHETNNQSVQF